MSYRHAELFYVVDKDTYESVMDKAAKASTSSLKKGDKKLAKKIESVLSHLKTQDVKWNSVGIVEEPNKETWNVYDSTLYVLTGEGEEPPLFNCFLLLLLALRLPLRTFCLKAQKQLKRLKLERQLQKNKKKMKHATAKQEKKQQAQQSEEEESGAI